MERFNSIEEAREELSYTDEDLADADRLVGIGRRDIAINAVGAMIRDIEYAEKQFPEMEAELQPVVAKIQTYLMRFIASATK